MGLAYIKRCGQWTMGCYFDIVKKQLLNSFVHLCYHGSIMVSKVKVNVRTDQGLVRENNEDVAWVDPKKRFFLLADGMGGHPAGEVASAKTIELLTAILNQYMEQTSPPSLREVEIFLKKAVQEVNAHVFDLSTSHEAWIGMGTTLCAFLLCKEGVCYAHVGDSRIYRLRRHQLIQLTQDHASVRRLPGSDVQYKNLLTRAVGTEPFVEPSIGFSDSQPHDRFLICSDGLTDLLYPEEIQQILVSYAKLEEGVQTLINLAKEKGGYDNITIILIEFL